MDVRFDSSWPGLAKKTGFGFRVSRFLARCFPLPGASTCTNSGFRRSHSDKSGEVLVLRPRCPVGALVQSASLGMPKLQHMEPVRLGYSPPITPKPSALGPVCLFDENFVVVLGEGWGPGHQKLTDEGCSHHGRHAHAARDF